MHSGSALPEDDANTQLIIEANAAFKEAMAVFASQDYTKAISKYDEVIEILNRGNIEDNELRLSCHFHYLCCQKNLKEMPLADFNIELRALKDQLEENLQTQSIDSALSRAIHEMYYSFDAHATSYETAFIPVATRAYQLMTSADVIYGTRLMGPNKNKNLVESSTALYKAAELYAQAIRRLIFLQSDDSSPSLMLNYFRCMYRRLACMEKTPLASFRDFRSELETLYQLIKEDTKLSENDSYKALVSDIHYLYVHHNKQHVSYPVSARTLFSPSASTPPAPVNSKNSIEQDAQIKSRNS